MPTPPSTYMEVFPAAIRLINNQLIPHASPRNQRLYAYAVRILERAQRDIEAQRAQGLLPNVPPRAMPRLSAESLCKWGQQLRQRREGAGMTRGQLAVRASVAESTIRNLETGRHKPTLAVLMRLQALPELGMPSPFPNPPQKPPKKRKSK